MDTSTLALLFVFIGIPLISWLALKLFALRHDRIKSAIENSEFPKEWNAILDEQAPIANRLPQKLRERYRRNIRLFISETRWEGQGELQIDDLIKITVAAQACLLTLGYEDRRYPRLNSIILYPSAFRGGAKGILGTDLDSETYRLGESWSNGTVILAWDSANRGALNPFDGQNVSVHEFAHQLDQEDRASDGCPVFANQAAYSAWSDVMTREYAIQVKKAAKGRKSVLDHYGATNPAEFFAVSSEAFFEKPRQLARKRPDLYAILKRFYKLDPAGWSKAKSH